MASGRRDFSFNACERVDVVAAGVVSGLRFKLWVMKVWAEAVPSRIRKSARTSWSTAGCKLGPRKPKPAGFQPEPLQKALTRPKGQAWRRRRFTVHGLRGALTAPYTADDRRFKATIREPELPKHDH